MRISSADLVQNFQKLTEKPLAEPVTITCDGRDRLVLLSIEEYGRLKGCHRRVYAIEDMASEQLAALEKAEVPPEYAYLNAELNR